MGCIFTNLIISKARFPSLICIHNLPPHSCIGMYQVFYYIMFYQCYYGKKLMIKQILYVQEDKWILQGLLLSIPLKMKAFLHTLPDVFQNIFAGCAAIAMTLCASITKYKQTEPIQHSFELFCFSLVFICFITLQDRLIINYGISKHAIREKCWQKSSGS